jgi:hypothetical protein
MYETQTDALNQGGFGGPVEAVELKPARRLRGARLPALPSGPLLTQVTGGVATLVGVYGWFGPWLTLIVGGVAAVVLGMLKESDKI